VAEAECMVELLLKLKKDHAMMLVEHDMDAVFALADHLTVMVNGQVIASGSPAAVRSDPHRRWETRRTFAPPPPGGRSE
jgi:branched-chain amino acid transport system ATP-binding protein